MVTNAIVTGGGVPEEVVVTPQDSVAMVKRLRIGDRRAVDTRTAETNDTHKHTL